MIPSSNSILLKDSIEKFGYLKVLQDEAVLVSKKMEYAVSVTEQRYWQLLKDTNVIGIESELEHPSVFETSIYPYSECVHWNKHFFGPIYLPKKKDKILITKDNIAVYFPLIQEEEKLSYVQRDSVYVNGKPISEYVFKNNYYFVLGDNRDNAIDSRYLGPVKQKDIVGIVFFVW